MKDLEQKARLYQAAKRVKALAPWEWMMENDIFGVQNPETEEIGFVSVMGALGEHLSVAVYLGIKGLVGFWRMHSGEEEYPGEILGIPQLQASFEDRAELTEQDRDEIKALGLKFRGRQAWPMFRSFQVGCFPWYLEPHEVQYLTLVLDQVLEMAPRVRENPELLVGPDEETYLVRVASERKGELIWKDQLMAFQEPESELIPLVMDEEALAWLREQPKCEMGVEVAFFLFPAKIGKPGERPRCAYMVLVVEDRQGLVLGNQLLESAPTLEEVYGQIPLAIVEALANAGLRPKVIRTRSEMVYQLLEPLVKTLNIEAKWTPNLPSLDQAKDFLMQRFI